jgi:hydroxymethylglutaryl-CoA lyase
LHLGRAAPTTRAARLEPLLVKERAMLFDSLPDRVTVYEVSPRDGLQNERIIVSTAEKVRLIDALLAAGIERIEATSFVSPKWVPQLADAEQLLAALSDRPARYSALCPNVRGLARARQSGIGEIAVFISASEDHNRKNLNDSVDNTLARLREVVQEARSAGIFVRGCISTLWGFRQIDDIDMTLAVRIGHALRDMGCGELSLGDTMGIATPKRTRDVVLRFLDVCPASALSLHMHDTRGTALANVVVGLELGLRGFDSSIGGLGGCPFAPGAAGNLATEDLVYMLHGMGIETGVSLDKLLTAGNVAAAVVGRALPGKVHLAGLRPSP